MWKKVDLIGCRQIWWGTYIFEIQYTGDRLELVTPLQYLLAWLGENVLIVLKMKITLSDGRLVLPLVDVLTDLSILACTKRFPGYFRKGEDINISVRSYCAGQTIGTETPGRPRRRPRRERSRTRWRRLRPHSTAQSWASGHGVDWPPRRAPVVVPLWEQGQGGYKIHVKQGPESAWDLLPNCSHAEA